MKFKSKPVKVEQRPLTVGVAAMQSNPGSDPFYPATFNNSADQTESLIAAAVRSLSPVPPAGLISCGLQLSPTPPGIVMPQGSLPTSGLVFTGLQPFLNLKSESEPLSPAVSPPTTFQSQQLLVQPSSYGNSNSQKSDDECEDDLRDKDSLFHGGDVGDHQHHHQHQTPQQQFSCTLCTKKFSRSDLLRKHQRAHVSSVCSLCRQLFNDKFALTKHQIEVHTMDRVFQCPQCDKGFKEVRTLRLHLKIHNAEYPEQCGVCQKVFRTKWQLKQHQMDHGGERPYPCPECAFTCKTKQQLNEHRRKHSGEKAYSCLQCGTRFTYRNGLIKHTKLNRCPKKIVTADGETIIKKRSRTVSLRSKQSAQNGVQNLPGQDRFQTTPAAAGSWTDSPAHQGRSPAPLPDLPIESRNVGIVDQKLLEMMICRNSDLGRGTASAEEHPGRGIRKSLEQQFILPHVNLSETGGLAYGLYNPSVCESGLPASQSITTTTTTSPTTTKIETTHQALVDGVLPESTISELSLATGLPESDIRSWAACLPAGSTVKVTHHFDTSLLAKAAAANTNMVESSSSSGQSHSGYGRILTGMKSRYSHESFSSVNQTELQTHESLMGASVGITSYQESFAVDPNEVLRKDHQRVSSNNNNGDQRATNQNFSPLRHTTGSPNRLTSDQNNISSSHQLNNSSNNHSQSGAANLVPKFEPVDYIKEELNFSEDDDPMDQSEEDSANTLKSFSNRMGSSLLDDHKPTTTNPFFKGFTSGMNNNNSPSMIHSANSRLLNCSRLLYMASANSLGNVATNASSYPGSPTTPSRYQQGRENNLHLNVKLEPVLSPTEPLSADSSFSAFSTSSPMYPLNLTSPSSSSAPYTPSSTSNSLLPDFDIDLPEMFDDVDPSSFAINDQDLTSIRAIVEQTFKDGRDVLDIISAVY